VKLPVKLPAKNRRAAIEDPVRFARSARCRELSRRHRRSEKIRSNRSILVPPERRPSRPDGGGPSRVSVEQCHDGLVGERLGGLAGRLSSVGKWDMVAKR
jgi:hypothetical protein